MGLWDRLDNKLIGIEKKARAFESGVKKKVSDTFSPMVQSAAEKAATWAEQKHAPTRAIPAGVDKNGDNRIRSGWSDPWAYRAHLEGDKAPAPTSTLARIGAMSGPGILAEATRRATKPQESDKDISLWDTNFVAPTLTALEVVNDANTRLGGARRDFTHDPENPDDLPEYQYTLPNGNKFTSAEKQPYFRVGDQILSNEDIGKVRFSPEGMEILDPKSPDARLREFGGRRDGETKDGQPFTALNYELPDGTLIPLEEYKPEWVYDAFPDGTVARYADGRPTPEFDGIRKTEINTDWRGPRDPRAPWQDSAGNVPFFDDDWDAGDLAPKETLPWLVDMNLQSAPYYVPKYRVAAAAGASAPYLTGYEGKSYEPTGRGFENFLTGLGEGTYSDKTMTNAQRVGGTAAPIVDSYMERLSGKAIGGDVGKAFGPKFEGTALGRFLSGNPAGRVIGDAAVEGLEEIPASILDMLEQDSVANYARPQSYNSKTGEMEYDLTAPRGSGLPQAMVESWASGAVLGGTMGAGKETLRIPRTLAERRAGRLSDPYTEPKVVKPGVPTAEELRPEVTTEGSAKAKRGTQRVPVKKNKRKD